LGAGQAEPENAEHLVALGLLLGSGDGAVGLQAIVVEDDVDLLAVDAATVVERLDVELEALPCRCIGTSEWARKIGYVADLVGLLRLRGREARETGNDSGRGHAAAKYLLFHFVLPVVSPSRAAC
jgi:hypothetical protein